MEEDKEVLWREVMEQCRVWEVAWVELSTVWVMAKVKQLMSWEVVMVEYRQDRVEAVVEQLRRQGGGHGGAMKRVTGFHKVI